MTRDRVRTQHIAAGSGCHVIFDPQGTPGALRDDNYGHWDDFLDNTQVGPVRAVTTHSCAGAGPRGVRLRTRRVNDPGLAGLTHLARLWPARTPVATRRSRGAINWLTADGRCE